MACVIMEEIIVEEVRATRLDLAARSKFAKEGESIFESRTEVEKLMYPIETSVEVLEDMFLEDMIEIG